MSVRICNVITRMIVGGPQQVSLLIGDYYRDRPGFDYHLVSGTETGAEGDYHRRVDRPRDRVAPDTEPRARAQAPGRRSRACGTRSALSTTSTRPGARAFREGPPARTARGANRGCSRGRADGARLVVQQCGRFAEASLRAVREGVARALRLLTVRLDGGSRRRVSRSGSSAVTRSRRGRAAVICNPVDLAAFGRISGGARAAVRGGARRRRRNTGRESRATAVRAEDTARVRRGDEDGGATPLERGNLDRGRWQAARTDRARGG